MTARPGVGLERFVLAQTPVYDQVCAELTNGHKDSHWMWFMFPQLQGLGTSATARYFGIVDTREAFAYWNHDTLRQRLLQCTQLVLATEGRTVHEIFGSPDDMKLHSCMTLFNIVASHEPAFSNVLARFFAGAQDPGTLSLVR